MEFYKIKNKIFNWTIGSFFRTIGRVVAYIGFGAIILFLMGKCEVKAETLFDYTLPQVARMGNITSATGYDTNELGVFQYGTTGNGEEYDYISFTTRYTYRTYGTYLQFCTDMYMEENHTYNVVIAITTGPGSTSRYFKLGTQLGMLRVTQSVTAAFYNYTPVNVIRSSDYHTEELFNSQDFQMLSLISVAFTLPENYEGKCLNFNIMTSSQGAEVLRFYGYLINDNGIDYSEQFDELANSIKSSQNAIINNQNENANMIKDSIDDMSNSIDDLNDSIMGPDTQYDNVDDSKIDDYQNSEDSLINKDALDDINNIQIAIDSNSNLFIWDIITKVLNTHDLIFGMLITFLSIGIIKLILNR